MVRYGPAYSINVDLHCRLCLPVSFCSSLVVLPANHWVASCMVTVVAESATVEGGTTRLSPVSPFFLHADREVAGQQ